MEHSKQLLTDQCQTFSKEIESLKSKLKEVEDIGSVKGSEASLKKGSVKGLEKDVAPDVHGRVAFQLQGGSMKVLVGPVGQG